MNRIHGFLVHKGIKVDKNKNRAIIEAQPPRWKVSCKAYSVK